MAVQCLYQVCDGLCAAPRGQGDDALPMMDADACSDDDGIAAGQALRINPYQRSALGGYRIGGLLIGLCNDLLLPVVIRLD